MNKFPLGCLKTGVASVALRSLVAAARSRTRISRLLCTTAHDECPVMVVPLHEVERFVEDCLVAVGAEKENASQMASLLAAADYRGHYSHGLNRLDMYIEDVIHKRCCPNAQPCVLKESAATAWVDGNNGFGAVVGNFCMHLAIEKAKECGVGWVAAKGSNHYGIASWYSMQALKEGLLGMSFTNTSPLMSPTRSKTAALGSNPLSLSAPGQCGDSLVLDMATTAVALGKIEMQGRKEEPIPVGWAQGPDGMATTDAELALSTKSLMPLGGCEEMSGYKGYGLAMLVETFCGGLSGSDYGPYIRRWMDPTEEPANLGQCFVAINPEFFAPGFQGRMSDLMGCLRIMEASDPCKPVLVHGDPERHHMEQVDEQGGIHYIANQLCSCETLAEKLCVEPMKQVECLE